MSDPAVVLGNGPSRRLLEPYVDIPYDTFGTHGIIRGVYQRDGGTKENPPGDRPAP